MTKSARIYGLSLYDLAVESGIAEQVLEQFREVRAIFRQNPEYAGLLSNPGISKEARNGMLEEAFGGQIHEYLMNFLKLLGDRDMLRELGDCCDEYVKRYNADNGIVTATVRTAVKLTKEQMYTLRDNLEKSEGKKIFLVQKVDRTIIGGLRVEMEGRMIDGSISRHLSIISKRLGDINLSAD